MNFLKSIGKKFSKLTVVELFLILIVVIVVF